MEEKYNDLRPICKRMMEEKWKYKIETKKWLQATMRGMTQDELIQQLDELNYKELAMAIGAGIGGDAWRFAMDKKRKMNEERSAVIAKYEYTYNVNGEVDAEQEGEENGTKRVQASKGRRKSDS